MSIREKQLNFLLSIMRMDRTPLSNREKEMLKFIMGFVIDQSPSTSKLKLSERLEDFGQ